MSFRDHARQVATVDRAIEPTHGTHTTRTRVWPRICSNVAAFVIVNIVLDAPGAAD